MPAPIILPNNALAIPNFPQYWITPCGEVYSGRRRRWLKPALQLNHHYSLTLINANGKTQQVCLPQLVGELFVPNPDPAKLRYVIPVDGNCHNYQANNLRWAKSFSLPTPPVSVQPGQQRRVTSFAQLLVLWQRYEDLLQVPATLSVAITAKATQLTCLLTDDKKRILTVTVRSRKAVEVLYLLLDQLSSNVLFAEEGLNEAISLQAVQRQQLLSLLVSAGEEEG